MTSIDKRDTEIINHFLLGKTAKEIGKIIFMSSRTVEGRLKKIRDHYDCKNNVQLAVKLSKLELSENTENSTGSVRLRSVS